MKIDVNSSEGIVTLTLQGRLDTASVEQATDDIRKMLAKAGTITQLVCEAGRLEYISSSGLRILLGLAKKYPGLRVTEVQPEVYSVLEMTGFTKLMTVERALRRLSLEGCEVVGRGGVGTVYRLDDDTIIKVFREGTTMDEVRTEITMAKEAFLLGMPTAISFDVVRVGCQYGLVYELLRAETLSTCIWREPERLDEFAREYAQLLRQLHGIRVAEGGTIPRAIERERASVRRLRRYFAQEDVDLMLEIIDAIPEGDRLLHLDLQTKNVMVQGGELMLIDMGEVGYGHPLLDLGHVYSAMVLLVGDHEQIIGMPKTLCLRVWERTMEFYFEGESAETIARRRAQIEVAGCVRNFSWLSLSDSFPEELVNECKAHFAERIRNRHDYIREVCRTFGDWKLD